MDKPTKPTDLMPRSFGGVKNNFSANLQSSGYEDGIPAIYGGDNLNYQLDATGKELDYCEKIVDFVNEIPIGKTITVDANNKLIYENLATDISGKADVDLTNVNNTGTSRGASWAMPSGTYDDLTLGASGATYTAPANGWFLLAKGCTASGQYQTMFLKGGTVFGITTYATDGNQALRQFLPCGKGQVCQINYTSQGSITEFRFIYAKGSESEA